MNSWTITSNVFGLSPTTTEMTLSCRTMPGMSGLELQKRLLETGMAPPIIMITGHGDKDLAQKAFELNASDFFNKPLDTEALEAALKRLEKKLEN